MDELMKIINKKFLKDHELLYLEDHELVIINNNGHDEKYTVCCKFI